MRVAVVVATSAALLALIGFIYVSTGSVECSPFELDDEMCKRILAIRLVRFVAAVSAGALLATSGTLLQAVTRNVLAEPYILGVSSGALVAVAAAYLALGPWTAYPITALASLGGGLAAFTVVTLIASLAGGSASSLILAGVGVTAVLTGVAEFELFLLQSRYGFPFTMLLLGTAAYASTFDAIVLATTAIAAPTTVLLLAKSLNALVLGDDYAAQLGVEPRRVRAISAALAALYAAIPVSVLGIVGFVGLIAPNLARLAVGGRHEVQGPTSSLLGALLTGVADTASRVTSVGLELGELPLGLYTSLVGGIFLAYMVATRARRELLP
jgi:iron complex transport system permease protein